MIINDFIDGFFSLNKTATKYDLNLWVVWLSLIQEPKMSKYITDLEVSLSQAEEEQLRKKEFRKINVDVTQGQGDPIYIWYKRGHKGAITRIQLTHMQDMQQGLISMAYTKIDKDLKAGTSSDPVNLWYYKGALESDVPIVDLCLTTEPHDEAPKFGLSWERLACDLTLKDMGNRVYLWVKRETTSYICAVTATDKFSDDTSYFQNGYVRMDVNTNKGAGGAHVYIWYLLTTDDRKTLRELQISFNDEEYESYEKQGYERVKVNLNKWTASDPQYLWYKNAGPQDAIKAVSLVADPASVEIYKKAGVQVIEKNIGKGAQYLCFQR